MTIKIFVFNYLTHKVEIDSTIVVIGDYAIAEANHKAFSEMYPDCQVNFTIDQDNFIFSPPYNMKQDEIAYDEGRMTWKEYCDKWYNGSLSGCNEDDMSDDEIERQIEEIREAEFSQMDSICY